MRVKVQATGEHGRHEKLTHGQFFGRFQTEAQAGGFTLARIRADPHADVQRHTHDAAHFILVTRGIYVSSAEGAPAVCTSPTLIYNPPGTTHRDRFQRSADGRFDGRFFSISIAPDRMKSIVEGVTLTEQAIWVNGAHATALAARLIGELEDWQLASPLVAEGLCLELIASVARRQSTVQRSAPRWLSLAREMLHDAHADLSVAGIAAACDVHPVHLARTFRRFFGCSPGAYLRRCRVERAAALIRMGSVALSEIALRCGFADQSHMTHVFQKTFSISPAAYRRQLGQRMLDSDNPVEIEQDAAIEGG